MSVSAWSVVALGYQMASRVAYVLYVGLALRRQERSRHFTRPGGVGAGFRRFRRAASWVMTNDGVSLVAVCLAGWRTLPEAIPRGFAIVAGAALIVIGIATKLWARATIGAEAYYWHNFFTETTRVTPARTGPYRFLKNPMYTLGYAHAYGLALVTASLPGLIAAVFDQGAILAFHRLVEKPHFDRHCAALPRNDPSSPHAA